MLDIGWMEMGVVALIALMVLGPKELPHAMRAASKWVRKARSLAREFQSGVDEMIREADLEDARKAVQSAKNLDFDKAFEETIDPGGEIGDEARDLERTARSDGAEAASKADEKNKTEEAKPAAADGQADEEGATVIEHPLKVAPAHSIAPPPEEEADKAAAGADSTSKRA